MSARSARTRAFAGVAAKEWRDVLREKSIVVALFVQLFIAGFSTYLAVGLLALYDPDAARAELRADVAYVGPGGFDGHLDDAEGLRIERARSEEAVAGFHRRHFEAVVQEEWSEPTGVRTVTLLLPEGNLQSTLLTTQIKRLLQDYEGELREARSDRLAHEIVAVELPATAQTIPFPFVYATLLPLLLLTPVFLSGAIASDALTAELQSRTLLVLRSAPAALSTILAGKLAVPLVLAPLQFLLWVGLLALNGIPVANLPALLVLSLSLTAILCATGFAIAARVRRDGPAQASYALAAIVLGVASLVLPRDPLNLVAVLAVGHLDASALASLALLAAGGAVAITVGFADAVRQLRLKPE